MKPNCLSTFLAALLLLVSSAFANYDPQTGRFLSPDPLGHAASMSLYDYCNNDPVNNVDPDGRFGKGIHDGNHQTFPANAPNSLAYNIGWAKGLLDGAQDQGVTDGMAILGDTLSFHQSTSLHNYTQTLDYWYHDASRVSMGIGVGAASLASGAALLESPALFVGATNLTHSPFAMTLGLGAVGGVMMTPSGSGVETYAMNAATGAALNWMGNPVLPRINLSSGVSFSNSPPMALPAARVRGNAPAVTAYETIIVDPKGNAIPLKPGEYVTGSPDGRFIQVRDAAGNPTGLRIDGPHKPASHPDPRAQVPHAHVPGVTNSDGTPWLPLN